MSKRPLVRVEINGHSLDFTDYVSCLFIPSRRAGQLWRKLDKEDSKLRELANESDEGRMTLFADPQGHTPVLCIQGTAVLTIVTHLIEGVPMIIEELRITGDIEYL